MPKLPLNPLHSLGYDELQTPEWKGEVAEATLLMKQLEWDTNMQEEAQTCMHINTCVGSLNP